MPVGGMRPGRKRGKGEGGGATRLGAGREGARGWREGGVGNREGLRERETGRITVEAGYHHGDREMTRHFTPVWVVKEGMEHNHIGDQYRWKVGGNERNVMGTRKAGERDCSGDTK